jgi:hypothetical protein
MSSRTTNLANTRSVSVSIDSRCDADDATSINLRCQALYTRGAPAQCGSDDDDGDDDDVDDNNEEDTDGESLRRFAGDADAVAVVDNTDDDVDVDFDDDDADVAAVFALLARRRNGGSGALVE